jgi:hypothetical protein
MDVFLIDTVHFIYVKETHALLEAGSVSTFRLTERITPQKRPYLTGTTR